MKFSIKDFFIFCAVKSNKNVDDPPSYKSPLNTNIEDTVTKKEKKNTVEH